MHGSEGVESPSMREQGSGTVTKRKDGRWAVGVTMPSGKRRWAYCKRGTSKKDASKFLERMLEQREEHADLGPDPLLGPFLRRWLEAKSRLRPGTLVAYESIIRNHLDPAFGKLRLSKLTPLQVQRFAGGMVSPQLGVQVRAVLRSALNDAIRWGMVSRNVAAIAEAPRVIRDEPVVLTAEQVTHLLRSTEGQPYHALFAVAAQTGMREGELLGLKWTDIDLESGQLTVSRTLTKQDGIPVLSEPKTKRSHRTIPLSSSTVATLRAHKARQATERLSMGAGGSKDLMVFYGPQGRQCTAAMVIHAFHRATDAAGLPRCRFHSLRHAAASIMVAQGVHPRVVMQMLGHSTVALTMDRYSHVVESLTRDAAERLSEAIG